MSLGSRQSQRCWKKSNTGLGARVDIVAAYIPLYLSLSCMWMPMLGQYDMNVTFLTADNVLQCILDAITYIYT